MTVADTPLPRRMRHLERDGRGYPVPFNVYRDAAGRPHFTVNDEPLRLRCIARRLCSICGGPLEPRRLWFVGGPFSAFHPHGAYNDPPMHAECCRYALRVCPYLALASYRKRIETRTLPDDDPTPVMQMTMIEDRPPVFVAGMAVDSEFSPHGTVIPARPFARLEFWQHGRRLADADGATIAERYLTRPITAADLDAPRIIWPADRARK